MKFKLFGGMTLIAALLAASCTSDPGREVAPGNEVGGEEVEVTFSLSTEGSAVLTRAEDETDKGPGGPGQWQSTIGKAQRINKLIYAIYMVEKKANGEVDYTLLTQYGQGCIDLDNIPVTGTTITAGKGQTVVIDDDLFRKVDNNGSVDASDTDRTGVYEITLRLMRNKDYRIAFWAQNKDCTAYDTDDLTKVTVNYGNAMNNNELRDAFCKVESFSVSATTSVESRTVVLTRPMAQINVGTTGADYKNLATEVYGGDAIVYSKIEITGVSNVINVVEDKIGVIENGEFAEGKTIANKVTFDWDRIVAFYNMDKMPTGKELYDGEDPNEEFLYVDLDNDGEIFGQTLTSSGYLTEYPTTELKKDPDDTKTYSNETFKYLSMCYVLVPAIKSQAGDSGYNPDYTSTIISVNVQFAKMRKEEGEQITPMTGTTIELSNVPAHRNWRTNILGGLSTTPDDPSSIFNSKICLVNASPIYNGEYNNWNKGDEWNQNEFPGDFSNPSPYGQNNDKNR